MSDKELKRYVLVAGDSNAGVAGLVLSVRAYNRKGAVRLANAFLRRYQYEPLEVNVETPGAKPAWIGRCSAWAQT